MIDLPTAVQLTACQTGSAHRGRVVVLTRNIAASRITGPWWSGLAVSAARRQAERDHHWNWTQHVGSLRNDIFARCVAVQTPDGEIQAAMTYRVNGRSFLEPGEGAVYGERLATAPRNREGLVPAPLYRGAGMALMNYAICHSYQLGLGGRMTLRSLPTPQTIEFYERLGFRATGEVGDDMMLYELGSHGASTLLRERGLL